jgi:hypothetical protein
MIDPCATPTAATSTPRDHQEGDVDRLDGLSLAAEIGQPDDGEDGRQQHDPLAPERLTDELASDDENDDGGRRDDRDEVQHGRLSCPGSTTWR